MPTQAASLFTGTLRDEHPRPDIYRVNWWSLNGQWEFERDRHDKGLDDGWQNGTRAFEEAINVPFPWQSRLSGIEDTHYTGVAWYRTMFDAPTFSARLRTLLHFQAVDYRARVWLNGSELGAHEGGFDPFSFDVTDLLRERDNVVVVRVEDPDDISAVPHGKQGGTWYTRVSGIWQPVWLEGVPDAHLEQLWLTPDPKSQRCMCTFEVGNAAIGASVRLRVADASGNTIEDTTLTADAREFNVQVTVPTPRYWSPEDPHLYWVTVTVGVGQDQPDEVQTYFGMRSIVTEDRKVYLNGRPLMMVGVLNQGYHPDGLYTYPNAAAMAQDLRQAKAAGFNLVRFHIKPEEPRMLYLADTLGLLVWEEPANFGDRGYGPDAKQRFRADLERMIRRDYNHPSIIIWGCLNETWGLRNREAGAYSMHVDGERQEYTRSLYKRAKEMDPGRLVVDNSPCNYDHVETDLNDWHAYWTSYEQWKSNVAALSAHIFPGSQWNYVPGEHERGEPMLNSECGAVAAHMGDRDVSFPLRYVVNELRKHDVCQGYIYTEMQDIEWEKNGIVRYDRSAKEFGYELTRVNAEDYVVLDAPPAVHLLPGEELQIPMALSLYSRAEHAVSRMEWEIVGTDWTGRPIRRASDFELDREIRRYTVDWLPPLSIKAPEQVMSGRMLIRACGPEGQIVAENFVGLDVSEDGPLGSVIDGSVQYVPASISEPSLDVWSGGDSVILRQDGGVAFAGSGQGRVEYAVSSPTGKEVSNVRRIRVAFEASAFDDTLRQTDEQCVPTEVILNINDVECGRWLLPDAPVDSRGVLSWIRGYRGGAYGYLHAAEPGAELAARILRAVSGTGEYRIRLEVSERRTTAPGGLILFGERLGRYPLGLLLELESSDGA